jgi:hypothetical protein
MFSFWSSISYAERDCEKPGETRRKHEKIGETRRKHEKTERT